MSHFTNSEVVFCHSCSRLQTVFIQRCPCSGVALRGISAYACSGGGGEGEEVYSQYVHDMVE